MLKELQQKLMRLGRGLEVEGWLQAGERIIPAVIVEGDPMDQWAWFRRHAETLGCWPLLLSVESSLECLLDDCPPVADVLAQAERLNPLTALAPLEEEEEEDWPGAVSGEHGFIIRTRLPSEPKGFWQHLFPGPGRHRLLLVPTPRPWEVFAWLNYGNWNESPGPELHVALHKMWHERWGAEPVRIAPDTLECQVSQRPSTPEQALELARLQTRYCSDIVHQGVGSVALLAAGLMSSSVWYFWWD